MSNKKVITLGLDYSQFTGGMSEVNRKMDLLDQEFKLAAETAKRFGSETDHLTAKQDQLTQKISLQSIRLEDAKKKYDAVMSAQDKSSKAIDNADKALLKERIALEKLNNELEDNKRKLDQLALSDADKKMALLEQEFELTTEKVKSFATETELLAAKSNMLTERITYQAEKVRITKTAYEDAKKSGEASEKQLDSLYAAYIKNETALEKLNNELIDNKGKMELSAKSSNSFGDSIRGMANTLGVNVSPALEAFASKMDNVDKRIGGSILAIGTFLMVLGSFTLKTAEAAGEIDELSHKTGLSTDTIQEFNYAAEFLEVSAETIGSSMAKMTKSMDAARSGSGDAADAFKTLKVRITDATGQLRDGEEVFYNVIDSLGRVKNDTEKNALSMAIFGRSAMDLNNLILEGSDGLKKYAEQAHEVGYVMDNETIVRFNNFDDTMVELKKKFTGLTFTLGEKLLPVFERFVDFVSKVPTKVWEIIFVVGGIIIVLGSLAKIVSAVTTAQIMLSAANTTVGQTGVMATVGMGPFLLLLLAIAAAIVVIVGNVQLFKEAMNSAKITGNEFISKANSSIDAMQKTPQNVARSVGYAMGTKSAYGGGAWVGEAGPEWVELPRGSQVYSNAESRELNGNTYVFNLTVPIDQLRQVNDVVDWANSLQMKYRQGTVRIG